VPAFFAVLWLRDVIPGVVHDAAPPGLEGTGLVTVPVQMTDFAFSLPRPRPPSSRSGGVAPRATSRRAPFRPTGAIEAACIATEGWFGHPSDPTASAGAAPMFPVLALIGLVPLPVVLRAGRTTTP
jgi:hypothetical protein